MAVQQQQEAMVHQMDRVAPVVLEQQLQLMDHPQLTLAVEVVVLKLDLVVQRVLVVVELVIVEEELLIQAVVLEVYQLVLLLVILAVAEL